MSSDAFVGWLGATRISHFINAHPWIWPTCESFHFMGLSLLIGVAGFFDLRLLGFMKRVPIAAIKGLMPWAIVGFTVNLVTGMVFFVAAPHQYVTNVAWWAKVFFLLVAGLNAMFFETTLGDRVLTLGPDDETPLSFKVVAALSLISWIAVLYFGRMLPFIGDAI
jgi:hypothetical protein